MVQPIISHQEQQQFHGKMIETAYIKTPLGIAKIEGDEDGISVISINIEEKVTSKVPKVLQEAVTQLNDYF